MARLPRIATSPVAALTLAIFATAGSATAQHIHDNHPPTTHDGNWHRILLISDWSGNKSVKTTSKTLDTLFARRFTNCACEPVDITIQETETRTHKVSVTGSYTQGSSAEASAKALAGEVKVAAHASVTIGGGYEWTAEHQYQITQSTSNPKCNIKDFTSTIMRYTATGTMDIADHKIVCANTSGGTFTNYCNKQTISSDGVGFEGQEDKWQQVGACSPCPCDKEEEPKTDDGDVVIDQAGEGDGNTTDTTDPGSADETVN